MRKIVVPALLAFIAAFSTNPSLALDLVGHTIKANLNVLARVCRTKTGTCQDIETPTSLGVYFGNRGRAFVYMGTNKGLEMPIGAWSDDQQGHQVRFTLAGNRAIWEATSEKFVNTVVLTRRGSRCTARSTWRSDNPEIHLESRGVVVRSCQVFEGNVNQ